MPERGNGAEYNQLVADQQLDYIPSIDTREPYGM